MSYFIQTPSFEWSYLSLKENDCPCSCFEGRVHTSTSSAEFWNNGIIMQHQSSQTRVPRFARVVPTKPLTIICFHVFSVTSNIRIAKVSTCDLPHVAPPTPHHAKRYVCWTSPLSPRNLPRNILQQVTFHKANQCELRSSMMIHLSDIVFKRKIHWTQNVKDKVIWVCKRWI